MDTDTHCTHANMLLLFGALDDGIIPELRADPALACSALVTPLPGEPTVLANARLYGGRYPLAPQMRAATLSVMLYGTLIAAHAPYSGTTDGLDTITLSSWRLASDFASLGQLYHPRANIGRLSLSMWVELLHGGNAHSTPEHERWHAEHATCPTAALTGHVAKLVRRLREDLADLPGPVLIDDERDGLQSDSSPLPAPSPPGGSPSRRN